LKYLFSGYESEVELKQNGMKKFILVTMMVFAVTCYTNLFAQKPAVVGTNEPGWTHIGHLTASFKKQSESISVLGADEFTSLRIKISEAAIHIERMQVFYESGDMEDISLREHFANGAESRSITLKHPERDIKKVAFTYHSVENAEGDKADIDLYGLKTNQPAGKDTYKDERNEVREEAREAEQELNEEAREAEQELNEESREAREEAREADDDGDDDSQSVSDAIEEGAKDAASAITDQKLKNKVGPGGETAYVDENGKYYYISNAGEKVFITKAQLRNKPDKDDNDD
jgi:hypothetical protein